MILRLVADVVLVSNLKVFQHFIVSVKVSYSSSRHYCTSTCREQCMSEAGLLPPPTAPTITDARCITYSTMSLCREHRSVL